MKYQKRKLRDVREFLVLTYNNGKSEVKVTRHYEKWFGFGESIDLVTLDGEPIVIRMRNKSFTRIGKSVIISDKMDQRFKNAGIDLSEK